MPKDHIDYANTVIYTISCRDTTIPDLYVGHTTNFSQRKHRHKTASQKSNSKLYQCIRANGGWENWDMTEHDVCSCVDLYEARLIEATYRKILGATLHDNDIILSVIAEKKESIKKNAENAKKTPSDKNPSFVCVQCDFACSKKSDWDRHLLRKKHLSICAGSAHAPSADEGSVKALTSLILEVVKQNQELVSLNCEAQKHNQALTDKLVEICGNTNTTMIHNYSNNHNKTFNLNVFLNETCKDAMNINEFIDSLQLQLSDLEDVGKLGFVDGISNIIVKKLKALDVHKRPVHCADKKREVIYIKDENKWEKDNDDKLKLRKAIKRVAYKNENLLPKYKELHPGCNYSDSKFSDHYSKLVIEAMGGLGNNDHEKQDKIIRNIAKEIVIDKS